MDNNKKNKCLQEINSKIKELNYRINQANCAKKNIKFYYTERIGELKEEIRDLEAQYIYYSNDNNTDTIDIHGATRYFIDYYIDDLIFKKLENYNKIKIITGKGTKTLFNHLKKHLADYKYNFKINEYSFIINK